MEKWVKIKDKNISNDYLISNKGKILNVKTNYIYKNTAKNPYAYVKVVLKDKNNKKKTFSLHRLVAQTFIPNPNNYPVVDHIDSNTQNNDVSNLRWCTIAQNNQFRYEKEKKLGIKRTYKSLIYKAPNYKDFFTKTKLKKGK